MSKFCWELDDSQESAPPTPSSHRLGLWELRGHISAVRCGTGWEVIEGPRQ